jgi:hypothetical protein
MMGGREYYGGDSTYEGILKYYSTLLYLLHTTLTLFFRVIA